MNFLIALVDPKHDQYPRAHAWFTSPERGEWGLCPLTEAGFVRILANPAYGPRSRTLAQAADILANLEKLRGYRYWPITDSWTVLTAPFAARIFGHQQVTDAFLLGLAIKENGVLVTFDRGMKYMAGAEFSRNLLVLE